MPLNGGHRHELIAVFISLFDFLPDLIFSCPSTSANWCK